MNYEVDTQLVREALNIISSLFKIHEKVELLCRRDEVKCTTIFSRVVPSEGEVGAGLDEVVEDEFEVNPDSEKAHVKIVYTVNDRWVCIPIEALLGLIRHRGNSLNMLVIGPVVINVWFLDNPAIYTDIVFGIDVVSRVFDKDENDAIGLFLTIVIEYPLRDQNILFYNYEKFLDKNYDQIIARLGKVKPGRGDKSVDLLSCYHLLMSHTVGKYLRALDLKSRESGSNFRLSQLLDFFDLKVGLNSLGISSQEFVDSLETNSLYDFINIHLGLLEREEYFVPGHLASLNNKKIRGISWDKMSDPVRMLFQILHLITREVEVLVDRLKKLCGESYEEVLRTVMFSFYPLVRGSIRSHDYLLGFDYSRIMSRLPNEFIERWKNRLGSSPTHTRFVDDTFCMSKVSPHGPLSSLDSIINGYSELFLDLVETKLDREFGFVFHENFEKVRDRILNPPQVTLSSSQDKNTTISYGNADIRRYLNRFLTYCTLFKNYLKNLFV